MTEAQEKFHWRLWSLLRKARPDSDRKAVYAELGIPASHLAWNNAHFDEWKRHCLAAAQPGNYQVQYQQVKMPETRKTVFIEQLLTALHRGTEYAESILDKMNRRGKQGCKFVTLETASEMALKNVMIALKKECRRCWPTKDDLLGEVGRVAMECDQVCAEAALKGLGLPGLGLLRQMDYEQLLIVLATLRRLASGERHSPGIAVMTSDPDWDV